MISGGPFVPFWGFVIPCPDCGGAFIPETQGAWHLFSHAHNQHRPQVLWRRVWLGPTGNWTSSNAAFTTSCRSCGSADSAPSLCLPLCRHAVVP